MHSSANESVRTLSMVPPRVVVLNQAEMASLLSEVHSLLLLPLVWFNRDLILTSAACTGPLSHDLGCLRDS